MPHSRSIPAACGLLAVAFLAPVLPSHAATITVPSDYPTMQKALDAAASGDTVLVLPGTYAGDGNRDLDFQGKDVVLRSRDGANVTTVEIGGSPFPLEEHRAVLFDEGETSAAVVEGFTFTGGLAFDDGAVIGILGASPTIRGCVLHDNTNSMVVVIDGDPTMPRTAKER